jgi:NADH:ubiquinone oxidoreductase subunit 4 (subunit M)
MPLLSIITFLPLAGALILLFGVKGDSPQANENARWTALWATAATFVISLFLLAGFDVRHAHRDLVVVARRDAGAGVHGAVPAA